MKQLTRLTAALCTALIMYAASPALALVSFPKATVNNASGTYTPNALINSWFEYNLGDDITLNAPTNTTNGQFVIISLHQPPDPAFFVTFPEAYQGLTMNPLGNFGSWQGLFFVDGATLLLVKETWY